MSRDLTKIVTLHINRGGTAYGPGTDLDLDPDRAGLFPLFGPIIIVLIIL